MLVITTVLLGILTVVLAVHGANVSASNPRDRRWFKIYGIVGIALVLAQGCFLYRQDKLNGTEMGALRGAVKNLQEQTVALMNAIRLQVTLNDFKQLEAVIGSGFTHLEAVIRGKKPPSQPPKQLQPLQPAIVEHVRIIQRRAASDKPDAPFGLQVVMQTDVPIQPVAFRVDFDHEISSGDAFIVGEGVYLQKGIRFSDDGRSFMFSFHSPAFTPSSSLVVAVESKYDVRVTKIERIQPIF